MTLIIHAAGDGDLGSDILGLEKAQKDAKRKERREKLDSLIEKAESGEVDRLIGALFKNEYPNLCEKSKRLARL